MKKIRLRIPSQNEEFELIMRDGFFSKICHQIPERSFFIRGKQLPLCSRCLSMYTSFFVSSVIILLNFTFFTSIQFDQMVMVLLFGISPLVIDGFTQFKNWRKSNQFLRSLTGILFGFVTAWFSVYFINFNLLK